MFYCLEWSNTIGLAYSLKILLNQSPELFLEIILGNFSCIVILSPGTYDAGCLVSKYGDVRPVDNGVGLGGM